MQRLSSKTFSHYHALLYLKGNQYGVLTIQKASGNYVDVVTLDNIKIFGMLQEPKLVTLNGLAIQFSYEQSVLDNIQVSYCFNAEYNNC